jgi:hypothetical protein
MIKLKNDLFFEFSYSIFYGSWLNFLRFFFFLLCEFPLRTVIIWLRVQLHANGVYRWKLAHYSYHMEVLEEQREDGRSKLNYTHMIRPGVTQLENYGRFPLNYNNPLFSLSLSLNIGPFLSFCLCVYTDLLSSCAIPTLIAACPHPIRIFNLFSGHLF